jgi:hypothetical protein
VEQRGQGTTLTAGCASHSNTVLYHLGEPEVSDFEVFQLVAAQDVLGLQVPVHDACK